MKKILFLLLCTVSIYGQTYPTNPTAFGKISINTNIEDNTITKMSVQSSDNRINWLQPINIPIPIVPTNYTVATPTLGAHLTGIDNKLGTVTATTAGISTRVWFTADGTTVGGNPYYSTNATSKGTAASAIQAVVNNDNEKKYYTQDLIGAPFASATLFPPGTYAGNLSASTTPNSAQQRWTVELYKCDNDGTPIASGVSGAVVGSLGVTVIVILDSGLLTLADGSVTNVQVSGTLPAGGLSMAVGQRIRYHVSAEKVGTAASNITQSVYYGTSYNSFLDVPVPLNTSGVQNLSTVAGQTTTDALNTLNASIPVNYSKIVYVNNANPNSATIFDDENPPIVNDNALKSDVTNLYVGTDASGWVYNSTSLTYVTKSSPSVSSIFYNSGSVIPASNTTAPIYRTGSLAVGIDNTNYGRLNVSDTNNGVLDSATWGTTAQTNGVNTSIYNLSTTIGSVSGLKLINGNTGASLWSIYSQRTAVNGADFLIGKGSGGAGQSYFSIDNSGRVSIPNLTGTGDRSVVATSTGLLKTVPNIITITTSVSITTATLDANSVGQNGKHVVIDNGVNAINITCNGGVTTSYGKVGTGAITFVQGSGRTLVQLSGTAVFNGIAGSTATLWSNGTTDYLAINNY